MNEIQFEQIGLEQKQTFRKTTRQKSMRKQKSPYLRTQYSQHKFHLDNEQPESFNAKLKLQEFSTQLHEQTQRKDKILQSTQMMKGSNFMKAGDCGWLNQNITGSYLSKANKQNGNLKIQEQKSAQKKMRQTLKFKISSGQSNQQSKRFSFDVSNKQTNKKMHLSFTNIAPMQSLDYKQIQKHIQKKNRPLSSAHYSTHKVMNFQKVFNQLQIINQKRIHSKVNQEKRSSIQTMVQEVKDSFLKTSAFNNYKTQRTHKFHNQSNQILTQQAPAKEYNTIQGTRKQHNRTLSENLCTNSKINNSGSMPFRKTIKIAQKKQKIMIQSIKKLPYLCQSPQEQIQKPKQSLQKALQINDIPAQISQKTLTAPSSSQLSQDYSLLARMLKHESQNILNQQLHVYINHGKQSYHNNFYSKSIQTAKNFKLNYCNKVNQKHQQRKINRNTNSSLSDRNQIVQNQTQQHYTKFSKSKAKPSKTLLAHYSLERAITN